MLPNAPERRNRGRHSCFVAIDLTPLKLTFTPCPTSAFAITAHGPGFVAINGRPYYRSLIVLPDRIEEEWGTDDAATLTAEHFVALSRIECDVLLLGTGSRQRFPERSLLRPFQGSGRFPEIMDTPAACRTYNILLAEGRAVAAALIIPSVSVSEKRKEQHVFLNPDQRQRDDS